MKQKINNRVLGVLNILGWITYIALELFNKLDIKIEWSKLAIIQAQRDLVTISDSLFIILFSINVYFLLKNIKNKKVIPWYIVVSVFYFFAILSIFLVQVFEKTVALWQFIPIVVFIAMLIIEIIREKRKKYLIIYSVSIVGCIILAIINKYNNLIWLVVASIMQFILSAEKDNETKLDKIFNTVILSIVILVLGYFAVGYYLLVKEVKEVDAESTQYCNQIAEAIKNVEIEDQLIRVSRDGKWGYINQDGKEVIPCQYDKISNNATTYKYVLAQTGNTYYIISKKGDVILTRENVPAPFYKGIMLKQLEVSDKAKNGKDALSRAIDNISIYVGESTTKLSTKNDNVLNPQKYDETQKMYEYKSEQGYIADVVPSKDKNSGQKYNITVKTPDGQIANQYENVNLNITNGIIETFTSGDIPYYDLDNTIQGIYLKENFQEIKLRGNYQILDVIDDKIILRNYGDLSNVTDSIVTKAGQILLTAKEINASKEGYIVKKLNDKMVYLDSNLNEKTKEFDFINDYLFSKGILICENKSEGYNLYDLQGNLITKQKYEIMDKEEALTEGCIKEYLLDDVYKKVYTK